MRVEKLQSRVKVYCFRCEKFTIQWITDITVYSPGSYRGNRYMTHYKCKECGEEDMI